MGIDIYVKKDGEYIYFEGLGSSTNFYEMRLAIKYSLENGIIGSRFPILQRTPDHEAEFSMEQIIDLKAEIVYLFLGRNRQGTLTFPAMPSSKDWM